MNDSSAAVDALVRESIRALDAYSVADADGLIKLDAMENPYGLPDELGAQLADQLRAVQINRYPDAHSVGLKRALQNAFALPDACAITLGNGSDELIQMLLLLVGGHRRIALAPTPTFSMYELITRATGGEFVGVPLRDDFSPDDDALLDAIARHRPTCIFLARPNNPSGNCFAAALIERIAQHADGLVVVDEAYFAFSRQSVVGLLARYENLMVLRTLSKSGMAGLRLGFLLSHPHWAAQLNKVRLPYNIGGLTQCAGEFCLAHHAVIEQQAAQIVRDRETLAAQLAALPGVRVYPSDANFLLVRTEQNAEQMHQSIKQHGVLIKCLHQPGALQNCLRVTVGLPAENLRLVEAFTAALTA